MVRLGRKTESIAKKGNRILRFTRGIGSVFSVFLKDRVAYRIYWGRSTLYRKLIHAFVILLTVIAAVGGLSSRFLVVNNQAATIAADSITSGNIDLLEQGGSVESILLATTTSNFNIIDYTVKEGDTFDSIARNFNVTTESIKLSNANKVSYYADEPEEGTVLRIPEINGVLIDVEEGDTLEDLMNELIRGARLDVIEINNLKEPNYELTVGSTILVPDGLLPPPPPPVPSIIYTPPPPPAPVPAPSQAVFNGVQFIDPLSNPGCAGYGYSRGFSSWHNGVDLTRGGGCPIRAAASGVVEFAGWSSGGEGFMVRIDHGAGVKTLYFHGDGQIWVTPGQAVFAGQDIMYMGSTGYSTGTHLHFSMKYNGIWIDPSPYVPYGR